MIDNIVLVNLNKTLFGREMKVHSVLVIVKRDTKSRKETCTVDYYEPEPAKLDKRYLFGHQNKTLLGCKMNVYKCMSDDDQNTVKNTIGISGLKDIDRIINKNRDR